MMLVLIITWQRFSRARQARRSDQVHKKALSIKPDYAEAYNNMGTTLQEQGKLEEAVEVYAKAIAISLIMLVLITTWAQLSRSKGIQKRR